MPDKVEYFSYLERLDKLHIADMAKQAAIFMEHRFMMDLEEAEAAVLAWIDQKIADQLKD